MTEIICTIINGIMAIIVAVIGYKITKDKKDEELRNERRKAESLLCLELIDATMELSVACCNALTGGANNGNVEEAKNKAKKAKDKYKDFERKVLAEELV